MIAIVVLGVARKAPPRHRGGPHGATSSAASSLVEVVHSVNTVAHVASQ